MASDGPSRSDSARSSDKRRLRLARRRASAPARLLQFSQLIGLLSRRPIFSWVLEKKIGDLPGARDEILADLGDARIILLPAEHHG